MKIIVTGGAGFVGSSLAIAFRKEFAEAMVVVFDNLKRRGSELNLAVFRELGIEFCHGDVRNRSDLESVAGEFDLMIEASAEPSVLAGLNGSPDYVLHTNLSGTLNCLEFARKRVQKLIFLSTSRVYSIVPLLGIELREGETRFEIEDAQKVHGVSRHGISEEFPTSLARSLYGATKLASELIIQEYAQTYGLFSIINRCGVIAGPGQFGKVDQGVFTLWMANHFFKKPLQYTGFGGTGKQVRDLLHPSDLYELIKKQLTKIETCSGEVFNVGGGRGISTSLLELTKLCREITGNQLEIRGQVTTTSVDIPLYVSDYRKASKVFDWEPKCTVPKIMEGIFHWIKGNEQQLKGIFG